MDPTEALRTRLAGLRATLHYAPLLQLEKRTAFLAPPESHCCSWPLSGLICAEPAGALLLGAGVADGGVEG